MKRSGRSDLGASEVLGTSLVLAATLVLVVTVNPAIQNSVSEPPATTETVTFSVRAQANDSTITLHHEGGRAVTGTLGRFVVSLNGSTIYDARPDLGTDGWSVGESLTLGPLTTNITTGRQLAVSISHRGLGSILGETDFLVGGGERTLFSQVGPTVTVTLAGGAETLVLEPPAGLLIEANVTHPLGRKYIRHVMADLSDLGGGVGFPLVDDGTDADRTAGDGVFSARAVVPVNFQGRLTNVTVTAQDLDGNRATAMDQALLIVRSDAGELAVNPTQAPAPGSASVCPAGPAAVRDLQYLVNGVTPVVSLRGETNPGDVVSVFYRTDAACASVTVTLVAYNATDPVFNWTSAMNRTVANFDVETGAGEFILTATVPSCYYAIDLVRGPHLLAFGPENTNTYHSRQGRLIDSDAGGRQPC